MRKNGGGSSSIGVAEVLGNADGGVEVARRNGSGASSVGVAEVLSNVDGARGHERG